MNEINIVIAEQEGGHNPEFVEIENNKGESIRIGKRTTNSGLTYITITAQDILALEDSEFKNESFKLGYLQAIKELKATIDNFDKAKPKIKV